MTSTLKVTDIKISESRPPHNGIDFKIKKITVSENQETCLRFLQKFQNLHEEGICTFFRHISRETKLPEKKVRIYVRALKRKGLVEYHRGLFCEVDGGTAGSGHCISAKGSEFLKTL